MFIEIKATTTRAELSVLHSVLFVAKKVAFAKLVAVVVVAAATLLLMAPSIAFSQHTKQVKGANKMRSHATILHQM